MERFLKYGWSNSGDWIWKDLDNMAQDEVSIKRGYWSTHTLEEILASDMDENCSEETVKSARMDGWWLGKNWTS